MNKFDLFKDRRTLLFLLIIVFIASILRLSKLESLPASVYWDEVAIGYNAYSIGETLRDEYGNFMPLLFRSYDDYKMPAYIYAAAIPIKVFGLSEFSVRVISAVFGILTVILTYFISKSLFLNLNGKKFLNNKSIGIFSAFFMAISPWHIQFSRGGFEANLALFFVLLGVYFFVIGYSKLNLLMLSFFSFSIAFYSYRSVYAFLPFLILGLIFFYRKEIGREGLRKIALAIILLVILVAPVAKVLISEGSSRYNQTSISIEVDELANKSFEMGTPADRKILYANVFIKNYFAEFLPKFLFLTGDPNLRHSPSNTGMLHLFEAPLLIAGLFYLFRRKASKILGIIILWLLVAPIPAAITTPAPHALRTLNILPIPHILSAVGLLYILRLIPKKTFFLTVCTILVIISASLAVFIKNYYLSYSKESVLEWGDGYKQLYSYLIPRENFYDSIVVSGHYWQPYAYALFYKKYNPSEFQASGSASGFGKYYFGGTSWDMAIGRAELNKLEIGEISKGEKVLVALSPEEYKDQEENIDKIHEVKSLNGKIMFVIGNLK